jgi:hypothetical protein
MGDISIFEFYFFWMIPSAISFSLSFAMAMNILMLPELRRRLYQQLLAILAITDMIKSISWLLGPKYSAPFDLCAVQEYLFQFGSLSQALVTILICVVATYTVSYSRAIVDKMVYVGFLVTFSIALISLIIAVYHRTAILFCNSNFDDIYGGTQRKLLFYIISNLIPKLLCVPINLCFVMAISRKLHLMNIKIMYDNTDSQLSVLVKRLQIYPVYFSIGYIPLISILLYHLFTGNFSIPLAAFAAVFNSSIGSIVSINYFYHHSASLPLFQWIRSMVGFSVKDSSLAAPILNSQHDSTYRQTNMFGSELGKNSAVDLCNGDAILELSESQNSDKPLGSS